MTVKQQYGGLIGRFMAEDMDPNSFVRDALRSKTGPSGISSVIADLEDAIEVVDRAIEQCTQSRISAVIQGARSGKQLMGEMLYSRECVASVKHDLEKASACLRSCGDLPERIRLVENLANLIACLGRYDRLFKDARKLQALFPPEIYLAKPVEGMSKSSKSASVRSAEQLAATQPLAVLEKYLPLTLQIESLKPERLEGLRGKQGTYAPIPCLEQQLEFCLSLRTFLESCAASVLSEALAPSVRLLPRVQLVMEIMHSLGSASDFAAKYLQQTRVDSVMAKTASVERMAASMQSVSLLVPQVVLDKAVSQFVSVISEGLGLIASHASDLAFLSESVKTVCSRIHNVRLVDCEPKLLAVIDPNSFFTSTSALLAQKIRSILSTSPKLLPLLAKVYPSLIAPVISRASASCGQPDSSCLVEVFRFLYELV